MAWKLAEKPRTVLATKTLAKEFAEMTPAPGDRPQKNWRSSELKAIIDSGEFRTANWASCLCKQDGKLYRVNGKHTSLIFDGMNGKFPDEQYVEVERYEADTLEDVAALYGTFDSRLSMRTSGDVTHAYAATCEELAGIPLPILNTCASGIGYAQYEEQVKAQTNAMDRAAELIRQAAFAQWYWSIVSGVDQKASQHLRRSPVVAAMFRTWNKNKGASTEFWTLVRDATGAKPSCPDRVLNEFLKLNSLAGGDSRTSTRSIPRREMFVKCIHGYNAWKRGQPTNLKYQANAKTPAVA